ncbi:MAG: retropepsin-like domain-containing protein [Acidobacteriaceae bacterium]|nr:retropepsin-like domain-containing protein [Acidobacteriaceae bacterium]
MGSVSILVASVLVAPGLFAQFKPADAQAAQPQTNPQAAGPQAAPRMMEVPLLDCSGLPCVDLTTGSGKTLRLLVDLGEANAYIDVKAAQSLGLQMQALKGSDGRDINQVQQTIVPGAKLGDLPLGDFPFMVLDTTPQADSPGEKLESLPGDGALTYGAFKNRIVQIDAGNHVLRISEPQPGPQPCPRECTDLVIKHVGHWGPVTLTTTGFSVNGQPIEAQLDTLFTGTLLVYPNSVEKLSLKKESKAKPKEMFPFIGNGMKLARADSGTIAYSGISLLDGGPLYFGTKDANLPQTQFDATAGFALLSRAPATFDFKGMHFWMDPAKTDSTAPQ